MHARVTRMSLKPGAAGAMAEAARLYMASTEGKPEGFLGALLLVSEDGAEATSVTFWRSRAAIEVNEAGGTYEAAMKPYEPLFRASYRRTIMKVGATTLLLGPLEG